MTLDQEPDGWRGFAEGYDAFARAVTVKFAEDALALVRVRSGERVLDVGAGTGALAIEASRCNAHVLAVDFSPEMIAVLSKRAAAEGVAPHIETAVMDAQALSVEDESFDAVFSLFGVIFCRDQAAGFRELHRALRRGRHAVVGAWAPGLRPGFMQFLLGTLKEAVPAAPLPNQPQPWATLADPDALAHRMREAGFDKVTVHPLTHLWIFDAPEQLAQIVASVSPGLAFLYERLGEDQRARWRARIIQRLRDEQGDGPNALTVTANLAIGRKPNC